MLSEDNQSGLVMDTITNTIPHHMECFQHKQMWIGELRQPRGRNSANYLHEGDMIYRTTGLKVPVVTQQLTDKDVAAPPRTIFGELMQSLNVVPSKLQMIQLTS